MLNERNIIGVYVADRLNNSGTFSFFDCRDTELLELDSSTFNNSREFSITFNSAEEMELLPTGPNCLTLPIIYKRVRQESVGVLQFDISKR